MLAGGPDPANPRTVREDELRAWVAEGLVEWWGHQHDMVPVFQRSTFVVLPSYREGVPKALLEACAAGRAIVTTDVPGCREVVRHGENGLLVPPRNSQALADAIDELASNPERRRRMGEAGRAIAVAHFSEESVVDATLEVYRGILGPQWPAVRRTA